MALKKKLLAVFGGLVLFTLLLAGMTLYVVKQWRATDKGIGDHYQRSLSLQRIRATTFRAFKEVPDAVTGDDPDSRQEFDVFIQKVRGDFAEWTKLAGTKDERAQVEEVRDALAVLVADAGRVFTLVEAGEKRAAFALMEGRLEDRGFVNFDRVTARAVASDRAVREELRAQNRRAQGAASFTLWGTALATLLLSMLLAAYLGGDLFAPLQGVKDALDDAAQGNQGARLDDERGDEIGRINAAFNRLMEAQGCREKTLSLVAKDAGGGGAAPSESAKIELHSLVSDLRGRVAQLKDASPGQVQEAAPILLGEMDALLKTAERMADFGAPLDLNLAKTDVRALLYEVVLRFHEPFSARGVGLEISCDEDLQSATFDRLKIREALGQCVKDALAALPARGGKIAIRARLDRLESGNDLVLEVASDGTGAQSGEENAIDAALGKRAARPGAQGEALPMTRAILEAHGGEIAVQSAPDKGTYVALRMPFRK